MDGWFYKLFLFDKLLYSMHVTMIFLFNQIRHISRVTFEFHKNEKCCHFTSTDVIFAQKLILNGTLKILRLSKVFKFIFIWVNKHYTINFLNRNWISLALQITVVLTELTLISTSTNDREMWILRKLWNAWKKLRKRPWNGLIKRTQLV